MATDPASALSLVLLEEVKGILDATAFAAGSEPVTIETGPSLPLVRTTAVMVWSGALYRWNGSAYVKSVPAADLTGQIVQTQITDGAVTTPKLAASAVTANEIAAGAVTAAKIAAETGITAPTLAGVAATVAALAARWRAVAAALETVRLGVIARIEAAADTAAVAADLAAFEAALAAALSRIGGG